MIALLLTIVVYVLVGYVVIWIVQTLAPSAPSIIQHIIWVIVVLAVLLLILRSGLVLKV